MTTTTKDLWLPKVDDVYTDRDTLIALLEQEGWGLEGCGTGFDDDGKILGWDIGVENKASRTWVMIDLLPYADKAKVSRVHYPVSSPNWNRDLQRS